ncbi:MAG: hypothetical protein QOI08_659, partial [Actinomycetota bacterium]|nr:hypothetical protein [Actinomycetota bacterium]
SARCATVDLRGARLDGLRSIAALSGATIGPDQLIPLAPALAQALGLHIRADDEELAPGPASTAPGRRSPDRAPTDHRPETR